MTQEGSSPRRSLAIGGAGVVLVLLAIGLWFGRGPDAPPADRQPVPEAPAAALGERTQRRDRAPRLVAPRAGPVRVQPGETVAIEAEGLTGDAPVALELALPEGVSAKSGRLVLPGLEQVSLDEDVVGQSGNVALAVPVEQLREPGRYLVEIRTDERSPLPLRRYAIEVR
jgi:hypothetical protein